VRALSLRELEAEARACLEPAVFDFIAGGADDEVTLRENEAAFGRIALLPRALRGRGNPDLRTNLLGVTASMPILVAPTSFHCLVNPAGERASARAAATAGVTMIVSMASTVGIEEVAAAAREAAPGAVPNLWFQLYIQPDLDFTESIVRRAESAGCSAVVLSVDSPVFGRRERDLRNGFLDLPAGLCCENLRDRNGPAGSATVRPIVFSPEISWEHVAWLRETTALPIVLKGLMHPEDAVLAEHSGAAAIIVSNHGGRQLDTVPAAIELLPGIADAIGGRLPLFLDGGVRRGTDVVKALALGAAAVGIGRPVLWGLAIGGEPGVSQVLTMLRAELESALALCGCGTPCEAGRDLVRLRRLDALC
jgi:4-hydroxymandelate oxidase